jgi:molybdopterin-containing oxidoreductase family iron-sulfur binding subunit
VNPDSAPGLETGDTIEIASPFGSIVATARIDPRMTPGFVAVPKGGGHEAFGRWAAGRGANVMRLVAPGPSPHTGANAASNTRVRITRRKIRS